MSSSSGKSFTGMVLVVLALFGAGGALVDKLRKANNDEKIVEPQVVDPPQDRTALVGSPQKPAFVGANLANDGTGTLAGNAVPDSKVALHLNDKTIATTQVGKDGAFSIEQERPLDPGQHVLRLQTLGSSKNAPIRSDQQIKLNVRKDHDIIVTFLEPGQSPQILQGIESGNIQNDMPKSASPMVAKSAPSTAMAQSNLATDTPSSSGSGPSKADQPNILIKETAYVADPGKEGQVTLSGTAQAGAKLRFSIDDIELGRTTADESGTWRFATQQQLSSGGHMLLAEQLNDKGLRIAHVQVPFDRTDDFPKSADKTMWDKFSGIFKVEPDANDLQQPDGSIEPAKTAPGPVAAKKAEASKPVSDKLADSTKTTSKPTATAKKNATSGNFAFESVSYEANAVGGVLELSGRGIAGSRVRLFKGKQEIGEVVADSKGVWSFSKRGKIKPGPHMFKAGHVLKSGRIASETRVQYDHVDIIVRADNRQIAARKPLGPKMGKGDETGQNKPAVMITIDRSKDRLASSARSAANGGGADHSAPPVTSAPTVDKSSRADRVARTLKPRSKTRKSRARRTARAHKPRRIVKRRSAKKRPVTRYYLSGKNKARYMAKRKRYPKSRRTPARVKVRNGTTLWGYSQHYYGRGRLYPHIRRANRRKIKNPNRIYVGQKLRVPRLKRRKKR